MVYPLKVVKQVQSSQCFEITPHGILDAAKLSSNPLPPKLSPLDLHVLVTRLIGPQQRPERRTIVVDT